MKTDKSKAADEAAARNGSRSRDKAGKKGSAKVEAGASAAPREGKGGATVKTDWGYKRAVDPAAVVDVPA